MKEISKIILYTTLQESTDKRYGTTIDKKKRKREGERLRGRITGFYTAGIKSAVEPKKIGAAIRKPGILVQRT